MSNFMKYIEQVQQHGNADYESFLNSDDIAILLQWFGGDDINCNENNTQSALGLLLWFYEHDSLDLYPVESFRTNMNKLVEKYNFSEQKLFQMFIDAKKLL
ncbi:hypothetical protein [Pelosinus fermentans]|uniref:Uncharacterized protein n=1 Tax=Pelosinus fermentans JBW45 TaxID=1192197 RepID=I8TZD0_9FIRM|nr:hypothetical protein [Pelosinus fermentans]AJQ29132.1 hypothetical protein JBW_03795 [Pelosinus fermentans JBW45]